jgi:mono/diheme cytochrome c family protein
MQTNHWYAAVPCVLALTLATASSQEPVATNDAGKALFQQHCAACHGVLGDGEGVVKHERKARSFKDGGFSFGNTPEALFRTISTGIPGTPMPGFDSALTEAERRTVAAYVRELGPNDMPLEPKGSEMVVKDRPLIVRGGLPPITEGVSKQVRGLLIGTPEGLTFEYRIDDVRLLGIRQGRFVNRSDWGGRGGTALEPLGKVVHLVEGGNPDATWRRDSDQAELIARMKGSWIRDGQAGVSYDLSDDEGTIAHVDEWATAESTSVGSGFSRHFKVTMERAGKLAMNYHHEKKYLVSEAHDVPDENLGGTIWQRWPIENDLARWVGVKMPPRTGTSRSARFGKKEDRLAVSLPLDAGESMEFRVTKLTTSGTDEEVRKALATEVGR